MNDDDARRLLVSLVLDWLEGHMTPDTFAKNYWQVRERVLDENWGALSGAFGQVMSGMDTAADVYSADPDRDWYQIGEDEFRQEAQNVIDRLRKARLDVFPHRDGADRV